MGEALLRSHIQALRQRLAILPEPVRIQRLVLEDNVVEFKVLPEGSTLSDGKRLNFLIYEADAYPHSGGVLMSEDERDEAMMEAMNGRIRDPDKVSVSDALVAACSELGVQDPALFACLSCSSREDSAASSVARQDASPVDHDETDLCFEGEDDNGDNLDYIGHVEDRESRPGWKKMKWQETEEQRILRRQEQLRRSETEPGQKRRKGGGGEMTLEEQKAADQQMWSSQEAFTILCNELFQLQTEGIDTFEADAVDYDVHQWNVRIRGAGGALGEDLQQLQKMFGYDYIELRLCFKEDLHPFYPPTVSVVRPRLQGKHDVLAALACHPRLQLRGWSPFQASKDLLVSIRHFLEKIARVDLANEQNDIARFSGGAFSELERQLAQLGNLCEIVPMDLRLEQDDNPYKVDPWAQDAMLTQTSLGAMLSRKKSQQDVSDKQKSPSFWAAGTGYGHDHHRAGIRREGRSGQDTWDPQAMAAAQVAQDAELKGLVRSISSSLQAASARSSSRSPSSSADRQDSSAAAQLGSCTTWKTLADLLLKSCLAWFLVRELSISYTNMGDRLSFFEEVFQLVQELLRALPEHAAQILAPAQPHLVATKNAAMTFLQTLGKSNLDRVDLEADVAFARLAVKTADDVEKLGPSAYPLPGAPGPAVASADSGSGTCTAGGASSSSAAPTNSVDREEAEYIEHMRERQFDMCDFGERHAYATTADRETTTPQARTVRLAKELAGLAPLLPLSGSSSVFVRVDSRRQQLWRVLVTGPDDTPYSNGCFMFDIYFPPMYPNEPPTVQLVTNGNNSVTFNPNLYASGKVCLSLLGTWKGEKAESWDPANSRTLQVLVSIQSLILVPEPYFNEPGYEREIGTKQGEMRSRDYSQPVREGCVRWGMLDHLKNSLNVQENKIVRFPEFQEVLQLHFQMRAQKMQETLAEWIAEAKQHASSVHAISLKRLLEQLAPQLALLQGVELGALEPTDALPVDAEEAPADGSEDARPLDADGMWEDGNESMPPG